MENRKLKKLTIALSLLATILTTTTGYCADVLLETQTSWDGGELTYPEGEAQITSALLHIEPGVEPPFHCHPVPTMGYILRGTLEVETSEGKSQRFEQGSSVVEVMKTSHRGRAVDGPVEVIVFYAGAVGVPTTVLADNNHDAMRPCEEISAQMD